MLEMDASIYAYNLITFMIVMLLPFLILMLIVRVVTRSFKKTISAFKK
jgi:hypothetical protein